MILPPGKDQGAVGQDAHLSQLLEGLPRIFLVQKKIRMRDLGGRNYILENTVARGARSLLLN